MRPGITRAAALLTVLTALSQLLGFVRDAVITAVYGAGAALDAYLVAQGLMNLVLALVAGAMAHAIVPTVSRASADGDTARASRTVQTALTLTLGVLVTGSIIMYLAADQVVFLLAPGFDQATTDLAVSLTRIVLVSTVFIAATNILAAAAQAHGRFFGSGVQGLPFNVVMIVAAAGFGALGIEALAVGFVVGSAARLAVQLPAVRAVKLRLRPRLHLRDPDLAEVWRLAPPILLSTAVVNVNMLVDRAVGSTQGEGTIAALNFGWRVVTLVDALLVVTVAAALYPAFSTLGTSERRSELRDLVGRSLGVMLVLLAPAVVLLMVSAEPIVTLIFGRGDFDALAIRATSIAVIGYAVSAAALGVRVIASRACFAMGDGRTPVLVAIVAMAVNVVGDLTIGVAYGIPGLAASTSLSLLLGATLLVVLTGRRHSAVPLRDIAAATCRVTFAGLAAGATCVLVDTARLLPGTETVAVLGGLAIDCGLVVGVYVGALLFMRSTELRELRRLLRERFRSRRGA